MRLAFGQLGASGALVIVFVGYLMVRQPMLENDVEAGQQVQTAQQRQIDAVTAGLSEANRRLDAAGKPTVHVPVVTPSPEPPPPDEFTADEAAAVRQIVSQQLSLQKVSITQAEISQIARTAAALIPKPADGKTPTAAEMQRYAQISVAAYCAGDRCRAPVVTPPPGPRGPQGEKGDPAPKITDEELLASAKLALAAYCAQDNKPCDGKPGADGVNGKDAPTVADMDCLGDDTESYWRIQFSSGPDRTALGPCRIGPDPN